MASPELIAKVVPALNRRPLESDEAVDLVADDGRTPLRMVLRNLGFEPGQTVRIQAITVEEPDPFDDP